ncbi:PREDICTED: putative F-box/FBD/LRR-repeat protein At5g56810 isoform X1 [Nicotiana attenuata]|uniref:F-boxfbd/lrr-repeat protein n=1 Tax=Nicotiana attenuata TaxID=49451 RepID=A0A314KJB7_NICAT|nr:PREDICTED: putative F-box/FBD/LRR-repeat protein At5g56810 isoform X1 [Nicotiana attenuata]OIT29466.1 putative f-boxfbd/lrr-repeat protein [Nicotiana attenuata]
MVSAVRDFSGRMILPLLALGGIAFGLKYYGFWGKRPARKVVMLMEKEKDNNSTDQVHDAKEDYFSQLPDDILPSILAHLPIHDAVRTSVLSRRWKYLFASMPRLNLRCLDMSGVYSANHSCCPCCQQKFLKGVNKILQLYSGRTVAHIEMVFCYGRKLPTELDQLMCSISRLGVERLRLTFHSYNKSIPFIFSLELLSQTSSLKHLFLNNCIVQPSIKVNFLRTLTLERVFLPKERFEAILSSCLNLEQLTLKFCSLPGKICVSGAIKSLVFFNCGVKEIDLQARNLCMFKCIGFGKVRFYFSFVPALAYVMIDLRQTESMPYIFGDFARDLPAQIEILKAGIGPLEVKYFQRETEIFRNLRTLHLVLVDTNDFDIVKISPILRFCPLLQYLILDIKMTRCSADIPDSPLIISPTCHTELKEAGFRGFHGTTAEIEFALYILRSAMVLERLILSQRVRCYSGFGKWENTFVSFDETRQSSIQRQLHGQAISTKAVVAFV